MKNYKPQWKTLPRSIVKEYKTHTLVELAIKHRVSVPAMRLALAHFGVDIRPPGSPPPGRMHHARKLSDSELEKILELDDRNMGHSTIARIMSKGGRTISRERIRQICQEAGHATRRSRMISRREILRAAVIARRKQYDDMVERASDIWKTGGNYEEVSLSIWGSRKDPSQISNKIGALRSRYGTSMFPYRRPDHWRLGPASRRIDKIERMSKAWLATGDIEQIKKLFGYSNTQSARAAIMNYRKKYPDRFPTVRELFNRRMKNR